MLLVIVYFSECKTYLWSFIHCLVIPLKKIKIMILLSKNSPTVRIFKHFILMGRVVSYPVNMLYFADFHCRIFFFLYNVSFCLFCFLLDLTFLCPLHIRRFYYFVIILGMFYGLLCLFCFLFPSLLPTFSLNFFCLFQILFF